MAKGFFVFQCIANPQGTAIAETVLRCVHAHQIAPASEAIETPRMDHILLLVYSYWADSETFRRLATGYLLSLLGDNVGECVLLAHRSNYEELASARRDQLLQVQLQGSFQLPLCNDVRAEIHGAGAMQKRLSCQALKEFLEDVGRSVTT